MEPSGPETWICLPGRVIRHLFLNGEKGEEAQLLCQAEEDAAAEAGPIGESGG